MGEIIKLRPYHPTYIVSYFSPGEIPRDANKEGFKKVINRIKLDQDVEIKFVEEYDDICRECPKRAKDEKGSVWDRGYSCSSSNDPAVVEKVNTANKKILQALGLEFGSVIKWSDLVKLLAEKVPILNDEMIGGPALQEKYDKGLAVLFSML